MDWLEEYRRKVVSAEEAAKIIDSGDRVVIPLGQIPTVLPVALAARKDELRNVEVFTCAPFTDPGWFQPGWSESFPVNLEVFSGPLARLSLDDRLVDYTPNIFSLMFKPLDEGREDAKPLDACIVVVSPPDKNGYCSFGGQLWTKKSYTMRSRKVLAEVDPSVIRMGGDSYIHVSQVSCFVETDPPKRPRGTLKIDETHRRIAGHLSTLVRDGDTVQVGIGNTTNCLVELGVFDKANDLGAHTELTVPGYAKLVSRGIITGKYKTFDKGKHVATAWSGDDEDLAFMDGNPTFEARNPDYVVNIRTIAAQDNMFAVNNAISMDLTGSICSESIGTRMYNGTGGQPEFHIGSVLSKGGRAIVVLPSTALEGAVSRVVPFIEDGSYVTVPRTFADIVITEYGIARLLGKSHRERAAALIAIAHPDFRGDLQKAAMKLFGP